MVISSLTGGMGNQLFQYAVGYALARRRATRLTLDLRLYDGAPPPNFPPRPYQLWRLNISGAPMGWFDQLRLAGTEPASTPNPVVRVVRKVSRVSGWSRIRRVSDREQGYDGRLASLPPGDVWLWGCWQCERYFAHEREGLLREFAFRSEPDAANRAMSDQIDAARTPVCVHVRRGDYTRAETLTQPCDPNYYARALDHLGRVAPDADHFAFSDDPDWVRAHLPMPARTTYVTHNVGLNDHEDLRLMCRCRHFVIANSTFSWWGAWLGRAADKVVIAPRRWYAVPHASEPDLLPPTWLRL